jgi:putative N6-adenine-specific DNA methylase
MYAWDMAPGLGRRFAMEDLLIADRGIEEAVREDLRKKVNFERVIRISGSDAGGREAAMARSNAERAYNIARGIPAAPGLGGDRPSVRLPFLPDIRVLPMKEAAAGSGAEAGFLITNPPYGKRLGDPEEAERTYGEMGTLRGNFPGWKIAVITDHPGFESFFGMKASSCREITNGAIPSYFFQYDLLSCNAGKKNVHNH